jgi:hypothetical protein
MRVLLGSVRHVQRAAGDEEQTRTGSRVHGSQVIRVRTGAARRQVDHAFGGHSVAAPQFAPAAAIVGGKVQMIPGDRQFERERTLDVARDRGLDPSVDRHQESVRIVETDDLVRVDGRGVRIGLADVGHDRGIVRGLEVDLPDFPPDASAVQGAAVECVLGRKHQSAVEPGQPVGIRAVAGNRCQLGKRPGVVLVHLAVEVRTADLSREDEFPVSRDQVSGTAEGLPRNHFRGIACGVPP